MAPVVSSDPELWNWFVAQKLEDNLVDDTGTSQELQSYFVGRQAFRRHRKFLRNGV